MLYVGRHAAHHEFLLRASVMSPADTWLSQQTFCRWRLNPNLVRHVSLAWALEAKPRSKCTFRPGFSLGGTMRHTPHTPIAQICSPVSTRSQELTTTSHFVRLWGSQLYYLVALRPLLAQNSLQFVRNAPVHGSCRVSGWAANMDIQP